MTIVLDASICELLSDPETVKVLATADEHGIPHAVAKGSLQLDENGNLIHLELVERSRTNRNLLHSLWQDRPVSILLVGSGGRSYRILGLPRQVHVSGSVFQRHYEAVRDRLGDMDLAGVWVIQPQEVVDQSWLNRVTTEEAKGHGLLHLDRIVGG